MLREPIIAYRVVIASNRLADSFPIGDTLISQNIINSFCRENNTFPWISSEQLPSIF